ncbi:HTH-type transcriptional repressor GlcR [Planctomycetales bacterium 10988]|nr:HTH-type transcriptional repressor GlcR [Planctomycetales bacterium 10988]
MLAEERRNQLLSYVRRQGFASPQQLAELLHVSESTIRRDLEHLEETGSTKRTHGGVYYVGPTSKISQFEGHLPRHLQRKQTIANVAKNLVQEGDTVLFDGGSTTYEVAQLLVGRPLQVVTNSLPVANLFASDPHTDLVLVGGYVYPKTGVALGPHAKAMLKEIRVRKTIMSASGITEQGLFNRNYLLVETERAMIEAAEEVIIVADSSKFGHQNLAYLTALNNVDWMVVDNHLSEEWRKKIRSAGIELIIADDEETN